MEWITLGGWGSVLRTDGPVDHDGLHAQLKALDLGPYTICESRDGVVLIRIERELSTDAQALVESGWESHDAEPPHKAADMKKKEDFAALLASAIATRKAGKDLSQEEQNAVFDQLLGVR